MCGIFGSTRLYSEKVIREKMERISFRGPDCSKIQFLDEQIVLAQNRLAVIDLNQRSDQPFNYEHLWITHNGEVYNFNSIRKTLIDKGYQFSTESDTEVICAAYLEYGSECVKHFIGMFAFVIYDSKKKELFGARDRLGQKPFYYTKNGQDFEFSSQLSVLCIGNKFVINEHAIGQYLSWGYIPDPECVYKGIYKLKAGHSFSYSLNDGSFSDRAYWDINQDQEAKFGLDFEQAKVKLKSLLIDSVDKRMISDVPLGVFLSGGVDSSLIAATAQYNSTDKINTYSINFDDEKYDESKYAKEVAERLGTNHHSIMCDSSDCLDMIDRFSYFYDEPFADSSAIPSLLLSKLSRNYVTVALSGDGADECFLGYKRYKSMLDISPYFNMPLILRKIGASVLGLSANNKHKIIAEALVENNVDELYLKFVTGFQKDWHLNPEIGMKLVENKWLNNDKPLLEKISDHDLKLFLNGDINTKVDRASMASSLEVRAPYLDHRIVEFSRKLPTRYKIYKQEQKYILKQILYDYLPQSLFARKKSGFAVPMADWLRKDIKAYTLDNLKRKNLEKMPFLHIENAEKHIKNHMESKADHSVLIWKLIVLNQWMESNKIH